MVNGFTSFKLFIQVQYIILGIMISFSAIEQVNRMVFIYKTCLAVWQKAYIWTVISKVFFFLKKLYLSKSSGTVTKYNSIRCRSTERKNYLSESQKESTFKHSQVFKSKSKYF